MDKRITHSYLPIVKRTLEFHFMKGPFILLLALIVANTVEGRPRQSSPRKFYGMPHHEAPNCDEQFQCGRGHPMGYPECVPASAVCNGFPDCSNGADESGCS
ncbi:hypothetical protein MAR_014201, partial [Mya arenaria]